MVNYKMKKTYISPEFLVVKLSAKSAILHQVSVNSNELDASGAASGNFGWVKEGNSSANDVNVWDDEW